MSLSKRLQVLCIAFLLPHSIAAAEPPAEESSVKPVWYAAMSAYKPSVPDPSLGTGELVSRLDLVEDDRIERMFRGNGGGVTSSSINTTWQFELSSEGRPIRAWRDIVDIKKKRGYLADRTGYCKGERKECEAWFEAGRHHSPRPIERSGKLAYQQWRNRVLEEFCVPGADFRPSREPLEIASSRVKHAYLILELTLDACGDVRDATVHVSSGKKSLDEAAVHWARRARYATQYELRGVGTVTPGRGKIGAILFEFEN